MCDMTHSYVWHDLFKSVIWRIHVDATTHAYVWHDSLMCVTYKWFISHIWITYMCDMTCVTWLIHMCDMTHAYVWHESLICVTWLNQMCMLNLMICHIWYVWHICHIYATYMCLDTYIYVTHICGIHMSHICVNVTYMCECHIYVWHTCALIDVIFDDMLHIYIYISRIYHIYVPWLIAMRAMNHWFYKKK